MCDPKVTHLLNSDGWSISKRFVQKLRIEMGLCCQSKKTRRHHRGPSTGLSAKAMHSKHVWTGDFVVDRTNKGGSIRMFTVLDEYSHECLCIHAYYLINATKVRATMSELVSAYGNRKHIHSDNGSEFIEKSLRSWYTQEVTMTLYFETGSPRQSKTTISNPLTAGSAARASSACYLYTPSKARMVIEDSRWKYNKHPTSSFPLLPTPLEFSAKVTPPEAYPITNQGVDSYRSTPSLRPCLDPFCRHALNHIINALRLTQIPVQFAMEDQ